MMEAVPNTEFPLGKKKFESTDIKTLLLCLISPHPGTLTHRPPPRLRAEHEPRLPDPVE